MRRFLPRPLMRLPRCNRPSSGPVSPDRPQRGQHAISPQPRFNFSRQISVSGSNCCSALSQMTCPVCVWADQWCLCILKVQSPTRFLLSITLLTQMGAPEKITVASFERRKPARRSVKKQQGRSSKVQPRRSPPLDQLAGQSVKGSTRSTGAHL
jgi:hypothetical protein